MAMTTIDNLFVLVAGWPASGKSTLAQQLAPEMGLSLVSKDAIKETMMTALGRPQTVTESQDLGRCIVPVAVARMRYRFRAVDRHTGHLDDQRSERTVGHALPALGHMPCR
ncbi:hypothetical protein BH24ACT15_BH24ACT15_14920 [soil metagenome]